MRKGVSALCGLALLLSAPVVPARADEESDQLKTLVAKSSPAIVTVKVVLKTEFKFGGQSQDTESRAELQGAVVSEDGLVMISNAAFATDRLRDLMGGGADTAGIGFKITPTDFKIVVEREEKEYSAFLAATDTNLGLSFLKVEGLGDRKLPVVDFASSASPAPGQKLVSVSRLSKGYDYAPYFESARVSGEIARPRQAWMLDGTVSAIGLPVYTLSGETVGVLTTIASGVKAENSGDMMGMGMLMRLLGGGGGGAGLMRLFVVPGANVTSVITQAKQRAVEVAAERAKAKAAQPAKSTKSGAGSGSDTAPDKGGKSKS
jgi:hypothetical protein